MDQQDGLVISFERLARHSAFTVDLDRTDEDEALYPRFGRTLGQPQRPFHVDLTKLGQGSLRHFIHHMHSSRGMNDDSDITQCRQHFRIGQIER